MSNDAVEIIEAEIIPEDTIEVTYTPATIESNLDALEARVDEIIAPYIGAKFDITDSEQVKLARGIMADLNKDKNAIDTRRKEIKKIYSEPLKAFETRVNQITHKISEARDAIKVQVDQADKAFRDYRYNVLLTEYEGCVGDVANVIPFEAVLDTKWLGRSISEKKACELLQDKAINALNGFKTLQEQELHHKEEVMHRYAQTLDLMGALEFEVQLNARDAELAKFQEAQEAVGLAQAPEPTENTQEAKTSPTAPPEQPQTMPQGKPQTVHVFRWSLAMEFTGTRAMAQAVATELKGLGITGATIKCLGEIND